jgi:hypothetical protein
MADAIEAINATPSAARNIPEIQLIPTPPLPAAADTVSLSIPAQAQLLAQQGYNPNEIALQLGVSADAVSNSLSISAVSKSSQLSATT